MMNCEQMQPNLLEYSLRPSSCPNSADIRKHLEECEACMIVLEQERSLSTTLSSMEAASPLNDVWPVIRDRIRRGSAVWRALAPWIAWSGTRRLLAAGVAVCALAAVFVGVARYPASRDQSKAVSHLVEMQTTSHASTGWTDDPLGTPSDRALKIVEEGS